ncbi:HAD-IA family hydrolase [Demequina sp. NBRC 110053]|uniref:HAD-IA family hydrolase n=1 Tax=Demequina sp. NBRC 110053 TaxID=1570342 RepID=UPI001F27BAC6|nr:HAD-IA family hydrolase [Demequina sp. NBRC 110053]
MTELRVRAVLCDMDGTLVDSNAVVDAMWNEFADRLGLDGTEVRAFAHGRPSRDTIARYVAGERDIDIWIDRIHHMEASRFHQVVEIPGAARFTRALPTQRWAVVTSALAEPARARLAAVGIEPPAVLIGADDVNAGKPDPEGYLRAARELGADPRDCVVFEDTDAGIGAGRVAGCAVVVVGENRSPATDGLPRVPDMTQVTVGRDGESLVLTLAT